jgi:hypothetical protein
MFCCTSSPAAEPHARTRTQPHVSLVYFFTTYEYFDILSEVFAKKISLLLLECFWCDAIVELTLMGKLVMRLFIVSNCTT